MSENLYAPPRANLERGVEAAPALWNPNAAALWSLALSPAFGAFLHMKNWEAIGDAQKASASRMWVMVTLGAYFLIAMSGVFLPDTKTSDQITRAIGIALLLTWYFSGARPQVQYVKEKFGDGYPRKGWGKALGLGVLAWLGFVVAIFVVAFVAALIGR